MISIFTHVMKAVRDTNSEPELPVRVHIILGVNIALIFMLSLFAC